MASEARCSVAKQIEAFIIGIGQRNAVNPSCAKTKRVCNVGKGFNKLTSDIVRYRSLGIIAVLFGFNISLGTTRSQNYLG